MAACRRLDLLVYRLAATGALTFCGRIAGM